MNEGAVVAAQGGGDGRQKVGQRIMRMTMGGSDMVPLKGLSEDLDRMNLRDPTDAYDLLPDYQLPITPERRLMIEILNTAVADVVAKIMGLRTAGVGERYEEAVAWFASDDTSWPMSFECVCEALRVEPSVVRQRLNRRIGMAEEGRRTRRGRGVRW